MTPDWLIAKLFKKAKLPHATREELISYVKKTLPTIPDNYFQYHYDWCREQEHYEIMDMLKKEADKRGIILK